MISQPCSAVFVILHHVGHGDEHWDLMIDRGDALATWRLSRLPAPGECAAIVAVRIGDHRRDYLEYEGPVSGNRGTVQRVDRGGAELRHCDADEWRVTFLGSRLRGRHRLTRQGGERGEAWLLLPDP